MSLNVEIFILYFLTMITGLILFIFSFGWIAKFLKILVHLAFVIGSCWFLYNYSNSRISIFPHKYCLISSYLS